MCQEAGKIIQQNVPCLLQTITAGKNDFHDTELFRFHSTRVGSGITLHFNCMNKTAKKRTGT